jgi:ribosomal protein L7/L12
MENLLPPLLILLAVAAVVALAIRAGARRSKASLEDALAGGAEAAAAASARLNEAQHRAVYSLIARGLTVQAIAAFREATGAGLVEARNAVILLDRYPQAFRSAPATPAPAPAPEALPDAPAQTDLPAQASWSPHDEVTHQATDAQEQPPAVVRRTSGHAEGEPENPVPGHESRPTSPQAREEPHPQRFPYRYRAIVSNGRQTLEVASNMLNDEIYNEIKALAQIGDAEDAAQMLRRHSEISIEDARAFVALL